MNKNDSIRSSWTRHATSIEINSITVRRTDYKSDWLANCSTHTVKYCL